MLRTVQQNIGIIQEFAQIVILHVRLALDLVQVNAYHVFFSAIYTKTYAIRVVHLTLIRLELFV